MALARSEGSPETAGVDNLARELENFQEFGERTRSYQREIAGRQLSYFENEFWTAKQRAGHGLHEISYRACFKPQLPRFFIERLSVAGDVILDPFMGRGTTLLEAALLNRQVIGCDISPLAKVLCGPRLAPPTQEEVLKRLQEIPWGEHSTVSEDDELLTFYHRDTLQQLLALRAYLLANRKKLDRVDRWIAMVATNRLTGHSTGFFSVYTLPPNQAASLVSQRKINAKRNQVPVAKNVAAIIAKKSHTLLKKISPADRAKLDGAGKGANLLTSSADSLPGVESDTVSLVVTSPPFLDVVDYKGDNWLRCWFNGIDADKVEIWKHRKPENWQAAMTGVLRELHRVLKPGGHVAFEVGEVRKGKLLLEDLVVPAGIAAGLEPHLVLVNRQEFTKTANAWGVDNLSKGTNSNRIILLRKEKREAN